MSDATPPPQPEAPSPKKRYFRRGKITAYRDQFMLADGTPVEGERFGEIKREIDFISARWYDADTGDELNDYGLMAVLEAQYRLGVEKGLF